MNLSSIVVNVLEENCDNVIAQINQSDFCKYHLHEKGKIIVTIDGANVGEEMEKLKLLESIPEILSANMVYSYCAEELEQERDKLVKSADYPQWLNDNNMDARNIVYNGDVKM